MGTFTSLAICFILVTLCWTMVLLPQVRDGRGRYLVAMVGLVAMFHGVRLLTGSGMEELQIVAAYEGIVDLIVASLTYLALVILHAETTRHRLTRVQLRLSQAMEPPSPLPNDEMASQVFDGQHAQQSERKTLPPEVELDHRIQESPIATVTFDRSGRVSSCNTAAEQLYGARKGGLLGKTLPALKTKDPPKPRSRGSFNAAEAHS